MTSLYDFQADRFEKKRETWRALQVGISAIAYGPKINAYYFGVSSGESAGEWFYRLGYRVKAPLVFVGVVPDAIRYLRRVFVGEAVEPNWFRGEHVTAYLQSYGLLPILIDQPAPIELRDQRSCVACHKIQRVAERELVQPTPRGLICSACFRAMRRLLA